MNTVVGFIGPEYLEDGRQITRAALEDHFNGKLLGLPMGCDACFTYHARMSQNELESLKVLLGAAGCTYLMSLPVGDDIMLNYQSTSYHDIPSVRFLLGKRPTPEFDAWLSDRGIIDGDQARAPVRRSRRCCSDEAMSGDTGGSMSRTRTLIAELRRRMGAEDPLPPRPERGARSAAAGAGLSPKRHRTLAAWPKQAARHTTALVGIGHVGTRYATDVVLQFQAELAVAHDAVATVLPDDWAQSQGLLPLQSRVTSHREFLLRPDLGRRLSEESLALTARGAGAEGRGRPAHPRRRSLAPLPAWAIGQRAAGSPHQPNVPAAGLECRHTGVREVRPGLAGGRDRPGRWNAKIAAILLGERPGLGTGDGLSAYLVYGPQDRPERRRPEHDEQHPSARHAAGSGRRAPGAAHGRHDGTGTQRRGAGSDRAWRTWPR